MPYLVLRARRIYGNPEISLAGLNIIFFSRMEEDPGFLDDKNLTAAFPSPELKSASEQQGQGCP